MTAAEPTTSRRPLLLPRELSPEGHDPAAGDLGYWAPDGDLVFYYDSDALFFIRIATDSSVRQRF